MRKRTMITNEPAARAASRVRGAYAATSWPTAAVLGSVDQKQACLGFMADHPPRRPQEALL